MEIWFFIVFFYVGSGALGIGHALLNRPTSRSALLWFGAIWFLPFLGILLYLIIGIDRITRKAVLKGLTKAELRKQFPELPALASNLSMAIAVDLSSLVDLHLVTGKISKRPLMRGNDLTLLKNGEETYPAMLEAIRSATSSVNLMTYIFDEDHVGQQFVDALGDVAGKGIPVRVLYDSAGCVRTSRGFFDAAYSRGVRIEPFFPLNPLAKRAQINLRNHRKLLVVDGKIGFVGGVNISEKQLTDDKTVKGRCHDLHLRVTGPIVQQLQEVFAEDWTYAVGEELLSEQYFPMQELAGDAVARVTTSGPDGEFEHAHLMFFAAITGAKSSIRIVTPYFLPEVALEMALKAAAMRGIETEVFLPQTADHPFIRRATMANLPPLLEAGVRIYERPGLFVHTKAYIVDDKWLLMGSPNMDPRSFQLNFEVMLETSNTPVVKEVVQWVDETRAKSTRFTIEQLKKRPIRSRLLDRFCNLFSPIL